MRLYRNILREAFLSTWKNKYLWFFGLFATLLGGVSELEFIFRSTGSTDNNYSSDFFSGFNQWIKNPIFTTDGWINIGQKVADAPFATFVLISLFLVVIILSLFMAWLAIVSQSALVFDAAKIKLDKKHAFREGLMAGINKFWPVLGLNSLVKVFLLLLSMFLSLSIVLPESNIGHDQSGVVFLFLFIVFIPLSIIFSFIIKYAIAFVIIKDEKIVKALKAGWKLFLANWLISLEMAFILFFIFFASSLILILLLFILAIPVMLGGLIVVEVLGSINFAMIIFGSAIIVAIVMVVIFGSFVTTFQIIAWTNLFIELIGRGGTSKLSRIFSR